MRKPLDSVAKGGALGAAVLNALPAVKTQVPRERDAILDGK